jgi:hypothetical protein
MMTWSARDLAGNHAGRSSTDPIDRQNVRYLVVLAAIFLLIAGGCFAVLAWVGQVTGTTWRPRSLAAAQAHNRDLLVLPVDLRHWAALKVARIAQEQPEIVLIGSSRGNQVRSVMFQPYAFYNASLTAWTIDQVTMMLEHVTRVAKPRVAIITLDYFMFGDTYAAVNASRTMYFNNDLRIQYQSAIILVRTIFNEPHVRERMIPILLDDRLEAGPDGMSLLGIEAIRAQAGFRWDGSFLNQQGNIQYAAERIKANSGILEMSHGGPRIARRQMAALEKLAMLARDRGITLVAVQLPILEATIRYLDDAPSSYAGIWREVQTAEMAATMSSMGIAFFDLSRLPLLPDPSNFIDAAHTTEGAVLKAVVRLLEEPRFSAIFPALDKHRLQRDLADAVKRNELVHVYHNRF